MADDSPGTQATDCTWGAPIGDRRGTDAGMTRSAARSQKRLFPRPLVRLLAVCADDFGQSLAISSGIATLAERGRINTVSCLVNAPYWSAATAQLQRLPRDVDLGLHFNLTEGAPLSPELRRIWPRLPTLPRLIAAAHLRRLPHAALSAEFAAQLDAFRAVTGRPPAHVDGHQHVHHLPGLRELILDALQRLRPWPALRNTGRVLGPGFGIKRALIEMTGGRQLQRELIGRGVPHNPALLGVYDFVEPDYRTLMQRWLAELPRDGALLFCHPGAAGHASGGAESTDAFDPIAAARPRELEYLASDAFVDDLSASAVSLGRVWTRSG